ncbi:hypothetical protein K1719_002558 [Acacia pycnantha]|nr:hypothetical protein K1719_002558 [Acacia pycnantha]
MERLKAIGFHRLVEINCRQINRSLCAQYMACFDPPTKQVSIRGKTRVIGAEHVHQLMGLLGGKGIEVKISEQNPTYRDFRRAYKNIKYKTLGDTFSGKLDENFEYLFVLFTLGTLLAPSASIFVSDCMLKVVTLTKDALGGFDWSSFILEELSQQIHKFNKDSHKSKANKRKTVGGCVYFLMLFSLQNFAFGDKVASEHESAMAYWTDDRVKNRALLEKKKKKKAFSLASLVLSHHTLHRHRLTLTRCLLTRLVSMLGQEMLALQDRLTESPNNQPSSSEECEEDDEERDEEDDDKEIDEEDDDKEIEDEDDEKEIEDEDDHIVDIDDDDDHRHVTPIVEHGLHVEPTEEEFVDMNGWHLQRVELLCLKPRTWINDTVMTMVAKTLVADQLENGGTVTQHIFNAHFMQKMIKDPMTWSVQANKAEILPDRI